MSSTYDWIVRTVEQVEYLELPVDRHAAAKRNPLLEAHVDAMNRILDEVVARHDDGARDTRSRNAASHVEPSRTQTSWR